MCRARIMLVEGVVPIVAIRQVRDLDGSSPRPLQSKPCADAQTPILRVAVREMYDLLHARLGRYTGLALGGACWAGGRVLGARVAEEC